MKVQHGLIALLFSLNAACVSVGLPTGPKHVPAEDFSFSPPSSPFKEIDQNAWQNPQNGNSISFFSNCLANDDRNLSSLQKESLSALDRVEEKSEKRFNYNQREALSSLATGTLDGVKVKMQLVSFKKNNCSYSLHYVAREENYKNDEAAFKLFIDRFIAK